MTPTTRPDPAWKGILDLCDEIGALKRRMGEGHASREALTRLREEAQRRAADLRRTLADSRQPSVFVDLSRRHGLTPEDLAVLAHLLTRFTSPGRGDVAGRDLLDLLCSSTFEKLAAMRLLRPEGALRKGGMVIATFRPRGGQDPLDVRFRLSDRIARRFTGGAPRSGSRAPSRGVYPDEHEYLLDLRDIAALHRERASLLFEGGGGEGTLADSDLRAVRLRIAQAWRGLERRLRATPEAPRFRFEILRREFSLEDDEVLIVVALLFQECFEADPFVPVVDLVKMVSDGEADVLRKRILFHREGRLLAKAIATLEDPIAEKDVSAVACLGNWVVERILGDRGREQSIPADERIDFHLYLRDLKSSSRFFRDLDGGRPPR
ncbi:MAG TPA: hypothetical protein VFI25_14620 [Planctomycetota bacterium]|nr:hypothetical protein [Planctomycetota bacterium]